MLPTVRTWAISGAAILAIATQAHSAAAFRTAQSLPELDAEGPVTWQDDVVAVSLHEAGAPGLFPAEVADTVWAAMATWNRVGCSRLRIDLSGLTSDPAAPDDGKNTIQWITRGWTDRGYDPAAASVTDVAYAEIPEGGWEIVEADIYINGEHYDWLLEPRDAYRDVQSVLTHELGHLLGLVHPCEMDGRDGAPLCSDVPEAELTTMYPDYSPSQAELSGDDMEGICSLYPSDEPCEPCSACSDEPCPGSVAEGEEPTPAQSMPDVAVGIGEACAASDECAEGACNADGYCSETCVVDVLCPDGEECTRGVDGARTCVGSRAPMGATCSLGSQCLGGECVRGSTGEARCTRTCGEDAPACPEGWTCETITGTEVCTPKTVVGSGGCNMSNTSTGSIFLHVLALLCGAIGRRFANRSTRGKR